MYRTLVLAVVALVCFAVAPALPEALAQDGARAEREELAALKGTWKCMRLEEGGKLVDRKGTYTVDGHELTTDWDGSRGEARFHINASSEPKHLDIVFAQDRKDLTIYVRAGAYLIQCGNRDGKPRPTRFATGVEGGGEYLIVWKIER
jgi:uncharacterized protein (TIGR03067 family)